MSSHSYNPCGRIATLLLAALLCSVGTLAAAQEEPRPKWELFGGYSFIYPNAEVHGVLPGGILPVKSALESNPHGMGTSLTAFTSQPRNHPRRTPTAVCLPARKQLLLRSLGTSRPTCRASPMRG